MALPPVHVLGVVPTPLFAAAGGINRLAVHAGAGARVVRLLGRADLAAEQVVDLVQRPILTPLVEVAPDGALGREVLGEVTPLAAGAEDVEDGVGDIPQVGLSGSAAGADRREVALDQGPLRVSDVAGIMVCSHPISTSLDPVSFPLWDRLLELEQLQAEGPEKAAAATKE